MERNKPLLYLMLCQRDRPSIVVITCLRDAKRGRSRIHAHQGNGLAAEHSFRCVLNHISDDRMMSASSGYILIKIVRRVMRRGRGLFEMQRGDEDMWVRHSIGSQLLPSHGVNTRSRYLALSH